MDNDQKQENLNPGFIPTSFIKTKLSTRKSTLGSKISFRPSRSISTIKSLVPTRVAPLGVVGNAQLDEEKA